MLLKNTQKDFCRARIQMGALLEHIKNENLWEGRAESFPSFLEEERINSTAAYQYMRVARKFFYELKLTDQEFIAISTCNMGILDLASQVITAENKDEIIAILSVLSERDSKQVLAEMWDKEKSPKDSEKRSKPVNRALDLFRGLPDDQRIEFMAAIKPKRTSENMSEKNGTRNTAL